MRLPGLLLLPLLGAVLLAGDLSITNLNLPMFDETGSPTRTLKAESAVGPLERPVLKSGVLEFHSTIGNQVAPGSTLTFEEAIYDKAGGFIKGSGPIRFVSTAGDLSGVGFHYDLPSGRLKLHRDVLFVMKGETYQGMKIHGAKADSLIRLNPDSRAWEIAESLITGPVLATDVIVEKVRYDKVETNQATYSAEGGTITLASPVTGWRGEEKTVMAAKLIQYRLDPASAVTPPADAPTP